jgi:type II secretion system protein D
MERQNTRNGAWSLVLAAGLALPAWGVQPGGGAEDPAAPVELPAGSPAPEAPVGVPEAAPSAPAAAPADVTPRPIRFNFKDQPFDLVLDFFARETGLPIIREVPAPAGQMTFISGSEMSFDEALSVLNLNLSPLNVQLRREDKYLYLTSLEEAFRKPTPVADGQVPPDMTGDRIVTVTIPLNNAAATLIAQQLAPLLGPHGSITPVQAQNMLVLVESAAQARRIIDLVRVIDSERAVDSQFRLFKLDHADPTAVVEALKGLIGVRTKQIILDSNGTQRVVEEIDVGGVQMQPDPRTRSIIVVGPRTRIEIVQELIKLLDVPESGQGEQQMMTFALQSISAAEAATHLEGLYRAVPAERKPTILPLADVGKVTIVGATGLLAQGAALLSEVDPGTGPDDGAARPERVGRIIALSHVTPGSIEQLASRLLSPRQVQVLRFAASPDGRSLVVSGPPADVDEFERFVMGLDVPAQVERQVRLVRMDEAGSAGAVSRARELFMQTRPEQEPELSATFSEADRTLTLVGSGAAIARFEQVLRTVQASVPTQVQTRTFAVSVRRASELAAVLPRLAGPMLDRADGSKAPMPSFEGLDELKMLVVRGQEDQFAVIEGLVKELDREKPGDTEFRVVRVGQGRPEDIAQRARVIYDARVAGMDAAELGTLEVTPDAATGSLLITAKPLAMRYFTEAVGTAQQMLPPARTTRFVEVRNARASEILKPLQDLMASADPIDPTRAVPAATIRVNERTNGLLVTAEEAQHALIQTFVARLDQVEFTKLPPMRMLQLRTSDAEGVARMLQQRYDRRSQQDRSERPVEVQADPNTNTLIVSAHQDFYDDIRQLVETLNKEQKEGPERTTVLFQLKVAKAQDVAAAMDRLYPVPPMPRDRRNQPMPWLQKEKEVNVSADPSSNSLIIDAPTDRIASLEELASRLDTVELPPAAELRTYRIEKADLNAVARTLTALSSQGNLSAPAQPGKQSVRVMIETEPMSQTLIVAGDATTFERVEQVLEELAAVPVRRELRILPIANAEAEDVRTRALAIYEAQTAELPAAEPVDVAVNLETNTLEVVGDASGLERFTRIIEQLQRQAGPARDVRLVEIRFAQASTVVEFLRDLVKSSASFRAGSGAEPIFEPIEATNSVMIAAQPGQMPLIEQLIRNLDAQQSGERPPLRMLKLRSTDAANLAQVLNDSYSRRGPEERTKRPVDVQADAATNTLIVSAHPDVLPEIEALVSELNETQEYDGEEREIRIFPLQIARAEELAQTIDQMFPEPPVPIDPRTRQPRYDLRPAREVVVRADRGTNSLIVDAPAKRLAGFEQLVRSLDQHKLAADTELRTYRVERAELGAVMQTLRQLASSGALGNPGQQGVTIESEPVSRTIVVSGPAAIFAQVERVLSELDSTPNRPETSLRLYALKHARAERLQPMLQNLLLSRLRASEGATGARAAEIQSMLEVAADKASNTLIVSGPEEAQEVAEQLIKSLDVEAAEIGRATIRVVPLTYADANQVSQTIIRAMPSMNLPSGGEVTVLAAGGANSLILAGAEADLAKVESLLGELDTRPMDENAAAAETFKLVNAEATQVAPIVERLLSDQMANDPRVIAATLRANRGQWPQRVGLRVEAEGRTNSLIVSAPQGTLDLARTIIERLDQPAEDPGRVVATFTPARGDAAALVAAVQRIADSTLPPARVKLQFVPEPRSGAIVVIGTTEQVAEGVRLLADFDERTPALPQVDLAVIPLRNASAGVVAGMVQGMLADRSRWPEELRRAERAGLPVAAPTVNADAAGNRLLVSAPSGLMPLARSLVTTLEEAGEGTTFDLQVFKLEKGEAASVAQALMISLRAGVKPGEREPVVTPEARSNSVLVAASPATLERAERLIRSMDESVDAARSGVRTVFLKYARAEALAPIVQDLLSKGEQEPEWAWWSPRRSTGDEPEVKVVAEPRLNAVIVSGSASVLDVAEDMIASLDAKGDGDVPRPLWVLPVQNADAAVLAETAAEMFSEGEGPAPFIRVDASSNTLIVRATPEQLTQIEALVQRVDAATLAGAREMRLVPVDRSRADAAAMALTLKQLLERNGGVRVEIISAEDLMKEPGTPPTPPSPPPPTGRPSSQVGNGEEGSPSGARFPGLLNPGALASMAVTAGATGQPEAAPQPDVAARPEEPSITIAVDPKTNSLIVVGSTRAAEQVSRLVEELQAQMPPEPGAVRIVALPEGTPADSIVQIVRETVRQVGEASAENPGGFTGRVGVVAEPGGEGIIVWANDTDFAVLGKLVGTLARGVRETSLTVKVYRLENARADNAAENVRDLVSVSPQGRQAQRLRKLDLTLSGAPGARASIDPNLVSVTPDPSGTAIIVSAPEEAFGLIDAFVAVIDQSPLTERLAIRRYALGNARAEELVQTFGQLFDAQRQGPGSQDLPRARFVADERTNAILVTASQTQHEEVKRLLAEADAELDRPDLLTQIFTLQQASPSTIERVIDEVIVGRDPGKRDLVQVSADDDSSVLVVKAPAEEMGQIIELVTQVDVAETAGLPVRTLRLERADASVVARTLSQFFQARGQASPSANRRGGTRVAIAGDKRSGTLIVAASDEDFKQVEAMVANFDRASGTQTFDIKVVPLKIARATDVQNTISDMVWNLQYERNWGSGEDDGSGQIFTVAAEGSNSIVLMGSGEIMGVMERVIAAMDAKPSDEAKNVVRAVQAEHGDLTAIQRVIEQTMQSPGWRDWWGPDPNAVAVEVDRQRRVLLLVGPKPKVDDAEEYIRQLDASAQRQGQEIASIALRHAQADRAARSINQFFQDRARSEGRREDDVSVIGSSDGNVLIVSARPDDLAVVRSLVEQIDQPELGPDRDIKVYTLKNVEPREAAATIQAMFPQSRAADRVIVTPQESTRSLIISMPGKFAEEMSTLIAAVDRAPGIDDVAFLTVNLDKARASDVATSLRAALPAGIKVQITPVERSNSLLLTGSSDSIAMVVEQIKKLDTEPPRSLAVFKRVKIQHAMADDVWLTVNQLMRSRRGGPNEPQASIDYSSADNTLSISATPDQLAQIEEMIRELDVPQATTRRTEFIKLTFASADQAAKALRVFYGRLATEAATPGARNTSIVADPSSNSLVISADEGEWEGIKALLARLDTAEYDTSRQLVVIPLSHADAESVARALNEGFGSALQRALQEQRTREEADRARGGQPAPAGREAPRTNVPAALGGNDDTPTVSAEPLTNALIVFASRKDLERIESVVRQLDVPDILKLPEPRVIPLSRGRASTVADALRETFAARSGRQGLRAVMIYGDDASNSVIVRAPEEQFVQILALAETLESRLEESVASPRVIRVRNMPAARLRDIVLNTFSPMARQQGETLTVEIERGGNALIVGASERIFEQVERLVRDLDGPDDAPPTPDGPQAGPGQMVEFVEVRHNAPQAIIDLLTSLGVTRPAQGDRPGVVSEPVQLSVVPGRLAIAVVAGKADAQAVRRLIEAMDAEPMGGVQVAEMVPLRLADAMATAQSIRRMLLTNANIGPESAPGLALSEHIRRLNIADGRVDQAPLSIDLSQPIRVLPSVETNALFIASTAENVRALKEIARLLDTVPAGEAVVVRIFPMTNASATRIKSVIDDLFRQGDTLRRLPGTTRQGMPSTTTGRALSGAIATSVDERTNTLVVAGHEEGVALVEVILKDLDSSEVTNWVEPTIIPVKHADPVRLARTLREVLVTGLSGTPEATALQRQVGRLRMLLAGGDPADPASRVQADLFAPMSGLVITPEESLGSLIVVGSTNNVRVIRELVAMLDVEAAGAGNEVRVYPLRFAAADRVARIAQEVFAQREKTGALRAEDRLVISTDTRTNALVVATSARSLQVLESLLASLDAERANLSVNVFVLPAPNADVRTLAPKIQRLMTERLAAARRAGVPESPSDAVSVEAEPATGSLIVAASEENFEIIRELVASLSSGAGGASATQRVEVIAVERGQASELAQAIDELYVRREIQNRGQGAVVVTANDRLNAIIVTGTEGDIAAVRGLIEQLAVPAIQTEQQIRRIELKTANALEVVNLLEEVLAGRPLGGSRNSPVARQAVRIRFLRDTLADTLESEKGAPVAEAEIDGAIRDLIRLTPDLRTNSVMISAPPQLMGLITEIINDLDTTTAGNREIAVFNLKNADAEAMAELLRDLFNLRQSGNDLVLLPTRQPEDQPGAPATDTFGGTTVTPVPDQRQELSITVDPRTNSLLVSGTAEYLTLVRTVVEQLDQIEATERERVVYHLKNAKAKEVEETLQSYFRQEIERIRGTLRDDQLGSLSRQLEQEVTVVGDEKSNKLVISASPRYIEAVKTIVEELDSAPPQVVIQVLLAEVTLDSEDSWGMDVRVGPFGGDNYVVGSTPAGAAISAAIGLPQLSVSSGDFSVLMRSLQAKGRLEVLSRPEVTVNNNEDAFIQVGENIAILDGVTTFDTGRTQANVIREDVGILLEVTPSISADGFVRLEIRPQISAVTQRTTQVSEDFTAPIISRRQVDTTVTVKDGQTIVIGGLLQTSDESRTSKVPFFGDAPIIGPIFRTRESRTVKTELLVILTPRVIGGTKPQHVARQQRLTDERIDEMTGNDRIREMLRQATEGQRPLLPPRGREGAPGPEGDPDQPEVRIPPAPLPGSAPQAGADTPRAAEARPGSHGLGRRAQANWIVVWGR